MPTLLPPGNLFIRLVHCTYIPYGARGEMVVLAAGQVRVPRAGDPTGWGQPGSRGQKGAVLLPAAAPAQVTGVTGAGAVGGAQGRWHRLRNTGTLGDLVGLLPSISDMAQITPIAFMLKSLTLSVLSSLHPCFWLITLPRPTGTWDLI